MPNRSETRRGSSPTRRFHVLDDVRQALRVAAFEHDVREVEAGADHEPISLVFTSSFTSRLARGVLGLGGDVEADRRTASR